MCGRAGRFDTKNAGSRPAQDENPLRILVYAGSGGTLMPMQVYVGDRKITETSLVGTEDPFQGKIYMSQHYKLDSFGAPYLWYNRVSIQMDGMKVDIYGYALAGPQ